MGRKFLALDSVYNPHTVAVIFDNGTTVAHKVDGDSSYQEVMSRLSLDSSRHLAPPYEDPGDSFADGPRRAKRQLRKSIGLPATGDVGALSTLIRDLRLKAESDLGIHISSAVIAVSHLVALYQDDVQDAFEYVGIEYVEPKNYFRPLFWETAAVYAGYGFGLCEHYDDPKACAAEEGKMQQESILAVHYSRKALTTSLAVMKTAVALWEPDYRHMEDFTLGYNAIGGGESEEKYWDAVRDYLQALMVRYQHYERPSKIILTGDMALDETFTRILKEAMVNVMGKVPPIFSNDPEFVATKGAAEFRRRKDF
ncbi:hypothetical protein FGG08_006417 [Glutinoglossum americanum]|uniref:Uncharacterized protein n=1 Tax=Glutinoglossum americanum TaxID=1670608 RepID=A0A9P8KV01_9PEZI|nr:hypothetical protein FGG08_006417 [Glutinoglossum americanum]